MTNALNVPEGLDASRPSPARIYDYMLGGHSYFDVDEAAAKRIIRAVPEIRDTAWANRGYHQRTATWIARQGVRQFIDIGSGLPTVGNTHEVVKNVHPDARVVYVDNDPMVLVHARALLASTPPGAAIYLDADLRDPGKILAGAAGLLDFGQPVAVLLIGILQLIPDTDDPYGIVARLMEAVAPGSWLAVFHPASDIHPEQIADATRRLNARSAGTTTLRTRAEIARFFDGLELLEPGLVQVHRWQPGSAAPDGGQQIAGYAGLARKC